MAYKVRRRNNYRSPYHDDFHSGMSRKTKRRLTIGASIALGVAAVVGGVTHTAALTRSIRQLYNDAKDVGNYAKKKSLFKVFIKKEKPARFLSIRKGVGRNKHSVYSRTSALKFWRSRFKTVHLKARMKLPKRR